MKSQESFNIRKVFDSRVILVFDLFTWVTSIGAILVGLTVILGWVKGSQTVQSIQPGLAAMAPLTAASFILAGGGLAACKMRHKAAYGFALVLLLSCGGMFASYLLVGFDAIDPMIEQRIIPLTA